MGKLRFPQVEGDNLEGRSFLLPNDLEEDLNLMIIPFKRSQQALVNQWVPFLEEIKEKYNFFEFYEIPTLNSTYKLMSFVIDGGMRSGIPDKDTRERTITLYINKNPFKESLGIEDENTIYLFLIKRSGKILWSTKGGYTQKKSKELEDALDKYSKHQTYPEIS